WNTLAHELGHVLGLEEACRLGASPPECAQDGEGQPVIQCRAVEEGRAADPRLQAIYDATMYPVAEPREIKKRDPEADDIAGVVAGSALGDAAAHCAIPDDAGTD